MRLYSFWYSPYVAKVRKCLELKGIDFEVVEVPYLDRREMIDKTGGYSSVPVLEDGGEIVTDSSRICAYLDARYPRSLRADPLAVVLEQWADSTFEEAAFFVAAPGLYDNFPSWQGGRVDARELWRFTKDRRYGEGCIEGWRRDAPALLVKLDAHLALLTAAVATKPFLLGDAPTLADAAVYGQLHMLEAARAGFLAEKAPALAAYFARTEAARA